MARPFGAPRIAVERHVPERHVPPSSQVADQTAQLSAVGRVRPEAIDWVAHRNGLARRWS